MDCSRLHVAPLLGNPDMFGRQIWGKGCPGAAMYREKYPGWLCIGKDCLGIAMHWERMPFLQMEK